MATNIVQMKDGSGNNQYPVTSAEAVGMPDGSGNLQTYLNKRVTELNISVLYPTNGEGGTNKYTLAGAIAQVPAEYRTMQGLKVTFVYNEAGNTETWEYTGTTWAVGSFSEVGSKKFSELSANKVNVNNTSESKVKDVSDGFYFTDKYGNVIAKILSDGLHAIALFDKDGNKIGEKTDVTIDNIKDKLQLDGFYFTDKYGNVIAKITQEGLQAIRLLDKDGNEVGATNIKGEDGTVPVIFNNQLNSSMIKAHPLYGELVVSLGDSHRTSAWYDKFCELTGSHRNIEIDNYIGEHQYDFGVCGLMMGQAMALSQYCNDNEITPRLILIENCHFGKITEDIDYYAPLREDNVIIKQYASLENWKANFSTDLPNILSSNTPKLRTIIKAAFDAKKLTLPFSATTVNAGTIILTIDSQDFNITIDEGETLSDAITKLNDWAFDDYTDWSNADTKGQTRTDSIELKYIGDNVSAPYDITFDGGTTGITIGEISETTTSGGQRYQFNSLRLTDWNDTSKWLATNGTICYPAMKGLLEFLKEKFPTTEIIVWAVQWLACYKPTSNKEPTFASETYSGSEVYALNIDEYYSNTSVSNYLSSKEGMKKTAEHYNCRFLDVDKACGINIFNMFEGYYNENDLHPKKLGYERWGETLANLY